VTDRAAPDGTRGGHHLPVAPGGDIALLNALGRLLLEDAFVAANFIDAHTDGFAEYRRFLMAQDLSELLRPRGYRRRRLAEVAGILGRARGSSASTVWAEPEHGRMWKNKQPHQPAPAHRPDR